MHHVDRLYFVGPLLKSIQQGNKGSVKIWYASQRMIDTCSAKGIECYLPIYDIDPVQTGFSNDGTSYIKIGSDQSYVSGEKRSDNYYPIVSYFDNFRVGNGEEATEELNFNIVDPAKYNTLPVPPPTSTPGTMMLLLGSSNSF